MSKTHIRTYDVFNISDENKRINMFETCHKKALACGLICLCHIDGIHTKLFMEGTKTQFIKYYLKSLLYTKGKTDGIKRLVSIILT